MPGEEKIPAPALEGDSSLPVASPDAAEAELDNVVPTRGHHMVPVVALGGSAGSIAALQRFFETMPTDSDMAFIVILHLSPEHESTLAQLLGRCTTMPVMQAQDGDTVRPNCVYVIPPGKHLTSTDGQLCLTELRPIRGKRVAVDLFFRTLADTHGPHATAIVLSGADGDGALGVKRMKERGGLTIAQDPDEADHASMPRSAIDTGMVDWVLPVALMPGRLLAYRAAEKRLQLPAEDGPPPEESGPALAEQQLREVLGFLHMRTGRDFTYYKRATVIRRLSRRMQVNDVTDLTAYLLFLRTHPGEPGALLQDLLISVTNFFRDREAFAALEEQMPALFEGKQRGDAVRVWVPACATGEEAYSIAILLAEHAHLLEEPPSLQIFASDLDAQVIASARQALYPETIAADVSEERLRRFFVKEPEGFRVRREIREIVLFAAHDLLKDSPFSRLDLVSCRNLLIYLNRDAQTRAGEIFHFALRDDGRLFLGSSESIEESSVLFAPVQKRHRLYARRAVPRKNLPIPVILGTLSRPVETRPATWGSPVVAGRNFAADMEMPLVVPEEHTPWSTLHFELLESISAPSVLITPQHEIVHVSESAGRFLHLAGGEPTRDVLKLVPRAHRLELRAGIFRALHSGGPIELPALPFDAGDHTEVVSIRICRVQDWLLLLFQPGTALSPAASDAPHLPSALQENLESELEQTKFTLRGLVEQYATSTEELKGSNEELQAMNEELRSATEELETGREELQSVNEELTTVNIELKTKVEDLAHANSDLQNLMAATSIAIVFLDRNLRIVRYTPTAVQLFHLLPGDIGRPLTDLQHRFDYPLLAQDAARVIETLIPVTREVFGEGRWFLGRLLPYRSTEDRILGAVLTFVEITERKEAEERQAAIAAKLRVSEERLRLILENAREYAILSLDLDRTITTWNPGAERLLGYAGSDIMGRSGDLIFTPEDRAEGAPENEAGTALAEGASSDERWHVRQDGSRFWGSGVMTAMRDATGAAIGFVKIFRDQTKARLDRETLEASQRDLWEALQGMERAREQAEAAKQAKDHFLAVLSHELRTPLTPVLMAVSTLRLEPDLPPDVAEALEMIFRNVRLEARFIDELLDVTRIERGKLELQCAELELHEVLSRAMEVASPDFQEKAQEVTVTLEAVEDRLCGDATRLQQVFWNLLKNAAKFTPGSGAIGLRSWNEPGKIVVAVSDSGIGFAAEAAERIFDPFAQADVEVTQRFGGLGLGLAIAKATIDGHGGTLRAESAGRDRGATFTVELPLAETAREF